MDWHQCTYATSSTFKTEYAVKNGTRENAYWNEAIKMLDEQHKRLQDEDVQIIFRPLNEAEGNANIDGSGTWF